MGWEFCVRAKPDFTVSSVGYVNRHVEQQTVTCVSGALYVPTIDCNKRWMTHRHSLPL